MIRSPLLCEVRVGNCTALGAADCIFLILQRYQLELFPQLCLLSAQLEAVKLLLLHFCAHFSCDFYHDLALHRPVLLHLQELVSCQTAILELDVEHDQIYQEEDGQQVETAHDVEEDLELRRQVSSVDVYVDRLDCVVDLISLDDIVDDEAVGDVVHQAKPEDPDNQLEEVLVVLVTNTVVQVTAVMVEAGHAAIAFSAVL